MYRLPWMCFFTFFTALMAGSAGCNGGAGGLPVTGEVTLDGQPVEGAVVTFSPTDADGVPATGTTDSTGRFNLSSAVGEGVAPGSYAVSIAKTAPQDLPAGPDPRERGPLQSPEQIEAARRAAEEAAADRRAPVGPATIPARYASPDTSGFTAEVAAGRENEFTFEMTEQ